MKKKKKACKTALYCKTKETAETGGKCFIGAHTQNIGTLTYHYIAQDKGA